jgi:3-oxoadipate enol-lactonase/4-carboxymuconolactone decarboxylase
MPLIDCNSTQLFYDLTGREDGPLIVLSNSLGTTVEMWDGVVKLLAPSFRILRYDTRGHGRSPVTTGPISIRQLADDLAGLLDALNINKAHIGGLSLGGITAQALAIYHPHKVKSLMLMATGPFLPPADTWNTRAKTVREQGINAIVDTVLARWFTLSYFGTHAHRVAYYRSLFLNNYPEGYALCCEAIRDMDLRPGLSSISTPTLVIAGAEDPVTPVNMANDLASAIKGSQLAIIPQASHLLAIEQPQDTAELISQFIASVEQSIAHPLPTRAFEAGLANRKAVLGVEHVQRSLANAGGFAAPWQDFITRNAWGEIWGDDTLPWKTRSIVTLAMMVALHREEEFKLHLGPALKNGVTLAELQALLLQTSVYAGVPAANAAFRWVRETLGDEADHLNLPSR